MPGTLTEDPRQQAEPFIPHLELCRPAIAYDEYTGYIFVTCTSYLYIVPPPGYPPIAPINYIEPTTSIPFSCNWILVKNPLRSPIGTNMTVEMNCGAQTIYADRFVTVGDWGPENIRYNATSNSSYLIPTMTVRRNPKPICEDGLQRVILDPFGNTFGACPQMPSLYLSINYTITEIPVPRVWCTNNVLDFAYDYYSSPAIEQMYLGCTIGPLIRVTNPANSTKRTFNAVLTEDQCTKIKAITIDRFTGGKEREREREREQREERRSPTISFRIVTLTVSL